MKSVYLVFCFTISPPLLTFPRIIMNIQMRLCSSKTTGWKELLYNIINGTTSCNNDGFGDEISIYMGLSTIFPHVLTFSLIFVNMQT